MELPNKNITKLTFVKLAKESEDLLTENYIQSFKLKVKPSNDELLNIYENEKTYIWNMKENSCTYNWFQVDEIPYPHTLAILKEMNQDSYDYCSEFFTKETMIARYQAMIYPISNQSNWNIPTKIKEILVLPP
ncbi:uncharacterized protein LOC125369593 [Ricinus communis]|uniref:uncharacterized protein LOC125369593 n=1 Tax=Ricinus communis TaxID=3988 RepID=UPI00201A2C82|nr:uncharacterized protein LOC125369593 [Ricinus communis]